MTESGHVWTCSFAGAVPGQFGSPAGGTVAPVGPTRSIARRMSPDAFTSSTNSLMWAGRPALPFATAMRLMFAAYWSSSTRDPGS